MSFGGGGGGRGHHCVLNYLRTDPRMSFHSQPTRSKPPSKGFLEKGVVWKLNTWGSGGGLWFILRFSLIRRAFSGSALGKQFRLICKFEVISQNTRKSRRRLPYTPPPQQSSSSYFLHSTLTGFLVFPDGRTVAFPRDD